MIRLFKAFFTDTFSWVLLIFLGGTLILGVGTLFNRYERVETYRKLLFSLEKDIWLLEKELEDKKVWVTRLETDPMAWEQVGREKMNYLAPNEVLIRFVPDENKK